MNRIVRYCAVLVVLIAAMPAFGDDKEKANKELVKVTAMATDPTAHAVVSRSITDMMGAKRSEMVQHRLDLNVSYGSMFVVEELLKSGAKIEDIAAQRKAGKTIMQIANDQHANWKLISADAKKLNAKIDDGLYKHFLNPAADKQRDLSDKYDVMGDTVAADRDADLPKAELQAAAERYNLWKDRAEADKGHHHVMDTAEQQAAYDDHDRNGGPTGTPGAGGSGSPGSPAPAAGGARTGPN
ncbi:MAG: hypothetical protein WAL56_06915 [Candidatus Sulfotelmatobacter sp.]